MLPPLFAAYLGMGAHSLAAPRAQHPYWQRASTRKVKTNKHVLSRRAHRAMRKEQRQRLRRR